MKLQLSKEQQTINSHNKYLAWKYFYPEGKGKNKPGYVLHHIDDTLRHNDIERYIEWNVEDLMMITKAEHMSLHMKGKTLSNKHKVKLSENHAHYWAGKTRSPEDRRKMSEAHKGKTLSDEHRAKLSDAKKGENNPNYGKTFSEETRRKMSDANKGERNPAFGSHYYYDKAGNRFRLFASDPSVISGEVLTLA